MRCAIQQHFSDETWPRPCFASARQILGARTNDIPGDGPPLSCNHRAGNVSTKWSRCISLRNVLLVVTFLGEKGAFSNQTDSYWVREVYQELALRPTLRRGRPQALKGMAMTITTYASG